ncbi:MAG: amino acid adenylation domain-containing protein [Fuerstiella sp.]
MKTPDGILPYAQNLSADAHCTSASSDGSRSVPTNQNAPASFAQNRMWLLQQLLPDPAAYHVPVAWQFSGMIDVNRLQSCLRQLMNRHEILRTSFIHRDDQLIQRAAGKSEVELPWRHADLSSVPVNEQPERLQSLLREESRRIFDLRQTPLWRALWVSLSDADHVLLLNFHHSIVDEYSVCLLASDLQQQYESTGTADPAQLPQLNECYVDFAIRERRCLTDERREVLSNYWSNNLHNLPPEIELPTDRPRPTHASGLGAVHEFVLNDDLVQKLFNLARQEATTLHAVLLAAFHAWMHRYTQQTDLVVGTPVTLRDRSDLTSVVGHFLNTLPIRARMQPELRFRDLLGQVNDTLTAGLRHSELPFEQIVESAVHKRHADQRPLHQVMFVLLEDATPAIQLQDAFGTPMSVSTGTSKSDLTVLVQRVNNQWVCQWEYSTDLFVPESIQRMAEHWTHLLGSVAEEPDQQLSQLQLMSAAERHQLLVEWNDTARDYPRDQCIHELFEAQVASTPDAVAVEFEGEVLTYSELNARANQLARWLQARGVGAEQKVVLLLERSFEMVIGIYGTLKAGGAYLPMDLKSPVDRLEFILDDASAAAVISVAALRDRIPASARNVLYLDTDASELDTLPSDNILSSNNSTSLAYVIYTSGSTGQPKGVMNEHRGVVNRLLWMQDEYQLGCDDAVLQKTPYTFDVSVWEFFWPLLVGSRLIVAAPEGHRDSCYLVDLINSSRITTIHFVPSMLTLFLQEADVSSCGSLRRVICSGEALSATLQEDFFRLLPNVELHNLYGPTEAAVDVSYWQCRPNCDLRPVPIGKPISNIRLYVLSSDLEPLPIGAVGELFIGGVGVARGYLNRPELTAEKFIPDPFSTEPGDRLFRTGDLARYLPDGNIQYIGRTDNQVKIRGLRIEPGEIESCLNEHPQISGSAVLAEHVGTTSASLTAYLTGEACASLPVSELRSWLSEKLPDYMIPSKFLVVPEFPLTSSGKLDRRSLSAMDGVELATGTEYTAPESALQQTLVSIWESVLRRPGIGIQDNFFELGGHSLTAVVVSSQISQETGLDVPLNYLFESPTIAALSGRLKQKSGTIPRLADAAPELRDQGTPASFAQHRMWLLQQLLPNPATYHVPVAWRFSGNIDVDRLQSCLRHLMNRHDILRTSFIHRDEQLIQVAAPETEVELPWRAVDLSTLPLQEQPETLQNLLQEESRRIFDLGQAPLWRALWISLSDADHVLLLNFHHSIVDEWSLRLLASELQQFYATDGAADSLELPAPEIGYADYSVWERQRLTDERRTSLRTYWAQQLHNPPSAPELPLDLPRPSTSSGTGAVHEFVLKDSLIQQLRALAKKEETTLFTVLLAAYHAWLHRYTQQTDLIIGTPVTLRNRPQLQSVFGFFLNTLPIRAQIQPEQNFRTLLRQVRSTLMAGYSHADLPFEEMVEVSVHDRHADQHPLHEVMFVLLEDGTPSIQLPDASGSPLAVTTGTCKNDLTVLVQRINDQWVCQWQYSTDLFVPESIQRMAEHWTHLLDSVAEEPNQQLSQLQLMSAAERYQLLVEWNDTTREFPGDKCVHELFEEQVARAPDAVAVDLHGETVTYRELNERASQLARQLHARGTKPECLIGVFLERSIEQIVGVLAILKSGGAYVMFDPAMPQTRLNQRMKAVDSRLVVSQERFRSRLDRAGVEIVLVNSATDEVSTEFDAFPVNSGNLCYVIQTSGSTGVPKGVEIEHRGVVNLITWHQQAYNLGVGDRTTQLAGMEFDAAVWEMWSALLTGATLVIVDDETRLDPQKLVQFLVRDEISVCFMPTPLAEAALQEIWPPTCRLRYLLTGGDQLKVRPKASHNFALINHYGPTESSVVTTSGHVRPADGPSPLPSIGRPIANTATYIVDRQGCPVPIGVVGELVISSAGLARGYRGDPLLTSDAFHPNSFSDKPQSRVYRTGDLARYTSDGLICFMGRADQQVKIRGFRIELGEVEAALTELQEIRDVVVLVESPGTNSASLTAYLTGEACASLPVSELRSWLSEKLPDYMIPSRFMAVSDFPLTSSGKLDRRSLSAMKSVELATGTEYTAPESALQQTLVSIWESVLRRPGIGIQDNFFELGGHSLTAVVVSSQISQETGLDVPLNYLFESPTIAALSGRLKQNSGTIPRLADAAPELRDQGTPASFAQHRMWLLQQLLPDPATYHVPVAWRFSGMIDSDRLQSCLRQLMIHHDILRTSFVHRDEQLIQVAAPETEVELPWRAVDLSTLPLQEQPETLQNLLQEESRRIFDLGQAPLWRALWISLSDADHVLLLNFHHSIVDEWSLRLLASELQQFYATDGAADSLDLPAPEIRYVDYSVWERQRLTDERRTSLRTYWAEQLHNPPAAPELPLDLPRPTVASGGASIHEFVLEDSLIQQLRDLARKEETTLFTVLLAAYHAWLHRYTQQTDLVIGTPVTLRNRPELQSVIGFFLNTLPIRARVQPEHNFRALLRQVRSTLMAGYSHADLPFEEMVEISVHDRHADQHPLHEVMFVLLEDGTPAIQLPEASGSPLAVTTGTCKNDLTVLVQRVNNQWVCQWEYSTDLFVPESIERMAEHWIHLLGSVAEEPNQQLSQLPLMSAAERRQLLVEWNNTARDYPRDQCIHELFEAQVARTPDAVAVEFRDVCVTYAELNARADQLSYHLSAAGVRASDFVGLSVDRSVEMVVALLGILKAGGAYVPLDADLPPARLRQLIAEAGLRWIVTTEQTAASLRAVPADVSGPSAPQLILLEDVPADVPSDTDPALMTAGPSNERDGLTAMSPAYVNYTSGSTGEPRGVVVPHRGVVRLVKSVDYVSLTPDETLLHLSTISFDASTFEIWGALLNGGRLVVMPPGQPSLAEIGEAIRRHHVTTLWLTAGLFHLMVDEHLDDLRPLRQLLAGGDVLSPEHVSRARRALPNCRLINGYGPTENTTFTCCYTIDDEPDPGRSIPIGRPISQTTVYLLDSQQQPVPAGAVGELYTGGDGLALGYLNHPDLTAEKFIPHPFSDDPDSRLYRTGDLGRLLPDGNIQFLGRTDHQVKLRGYRVELGEIEATLRQLPEVQDAVVLANITASGDRQLVAFFVPDMPSHNSVDDDGSSEKACVSGSILRSRLAEKLPCYMVPTQYHAVQDLPLTANGKVDRRALAERSLDQVEAGEGPKTALEQQLAEIWQQLLPVDKISRDANFFELGGHSLLAAKLVTRIEKDIGCHLSIANVLQCPTIATQARFIDDSDWMPKWTSLVPLQSQGTKSALFCIHGWGGSALGFTDLARHLGPERPVYGLQAVGLDGRSPRQTTVEQMARHYAAEIQSFQDCGPYHLAGHSLGGWIAYAVAQELRAQGRRVAFLALLDTQASSNVGWKVYTKIMLPVLVNRSFYHLRRAWHLPMKQRFRYLANRLKWLKMHLPGTHRELPTEVTDALALPDPDAGSMIDYFDAVATTYRPKTYPGDVVVFAGEDVENFQHEKFWKCFVRGRVDFYRVAGDHHSLISGENSKEMSILFRRLLDAADDQTERE